MGSRLLNQPTPRSPPVSYDSLHTMMRVAIQLHSQTINAGFNSDLEAGGKFEEVGVEISRINLERGGFDLEDG